MESILEILANNFKGGILSTLVLMFLSFIILFKKEIPIWVNRVLNFKNKFTIKSLKHHDIFNTCVRVEKEVSLMKFYTHGKYDIVKSKMCNDFTKHKIEVCSKGFEDILKLDIDAMTSDEFKLVIIATQNQMHLDYISEIKRDWRNKGISDEDIDYVIELFEVFRYDVIQGFEHRINSIFGSTSHENNTRRMLAVFEMWAFGIDMLPRDMKTTFETVNGRFAKIKY